MNLLKTLGVLLISFVVLSAVASPAMAQDAQALEKLKVEAEKYKTSFGGPAWGAGLGAGLIIIGAALGFGKIGSSALESMARQPETAGQVQTAMIIIGALLEGATFFGLIVCILLAGK